MSLSIWINIREQVKVTEYSYLPSGELHSIKDALGNFTYFEYNAKGLLIKKSEPDNKVYLFGYDENGNLISETDPNGNVKNYTIDNKNQVTKVTLPDDEYNFTYSPKGEVISISNSLAAVTQVFDTKGKVLSSIVQGTGALGAYPAIELQYTYDKNGNRETLRSEALNLNYFYDQSNRVRALTNSSGDSFSFDFDTANRLIKISRPGSQSVFTYNTGNMLESVMHMKQSDLIDSNQYFYDQRNIPVQKRTIAGNFDYVHDSNGQLIYTSSPVANETFSYDSNSNRISDQNGSYSYSSSGKLVEQDYNYIYTHDRNGNMIGKFSKAAGGDKVNYLYNSLNQLREIQFHSSSDSLKKHVKYFYDPKGRRIKKSVVDYIDSSKSMVRSYVYDGENIIAEYDSSGNRLASYTHSPLRPDDVLSADITSNGQDAGLAYSSGRFYYLKDRSGSVDSIVDGIGNVIQKYQYSVFGKIINLLDGNNQILVNPKVNTSFAYTGREFDQESGFYFYRARTFDPNLGRFLQADSDPGKLVSPISISNKYAYGLNSPVQYVDPSGLFYIPVVSELLDFGHNFIADVGAALDRILKSPGFQTLATATLVVIGTIAAGITSPAIAIAAGISALVSIGISGDDYSAGMFLSKFPMSLFVGMYISPAITEFFLGTTASSGSVIADGVSSGVTGAPFSVLFGFILGTLPR